MATKHPLRSALLAGSTVLAAVVGVTGCTAAPSSSVSGSSVPTAAAPSATPTSAAPTPTTAPSAAAAASGANGFTGAQQPSGDPATVVDELEAPWSIARLADGTTFVDERDTGVIKEVKADGSAGAIGTVAGVTASGEGGLLGIEPYVDDATTYLYAYLTTATDNRVVRMPLLGSAGAFSLGPATAVLTGIAKANNHDGGRIKFGPDGMLYITAGDASQTGNAQNLSSLNGKILRVTPTGAVPGDNPFAGSPVWSYGHRNPQGIAWAADGTMYAAEFGQDTWDELNIITKGSNYGWPTVEGYGDAAPGAQFSQGGTTFTNPIAQWSTDDASPSGLVMLGDTLFMAGLGGERLWSITLTGAVNGTAQAVNVTSYFDGTLGRIRDVAPGPGGTLLMLTNNTDGRGNPKAGDDRLASVAVVAAS